MIFNTVMDLITSFYCTTKVRELKYINIGFQEMGVFSKTYTKKYARSYTHKHNIQRLCFFQSPPTNYTHMDLARTWISKGINIEVATRWDQIQKHLFT